MLIGFLLEIKIELDHPLYGILQLLDPFVIVHGRLIFLIG